jgi:four helix bundle protein
MRTESIGMRCASKHGMPRRHEHLECWKLADQLRKKLIACTGQVRSAERDFRFTSNLRDAISSACRNQSEGFYKYKHSTQRPYFNTAQGSLGETLDNIQDGLERGHFTEEEAKEMTDLCERAMKADRKWLQSLDRPDPE